MPRTSHAALFTNDALMRASRAGARHDGLTPTQRRVMIGLVIAAHVAVSYALLQVSEIREAVAGAAPLFVSILPAPVEKVQPAVVPRPVRKVHDAPRPVITAAPTQTPVPAEFSVAPAPPEPVPLSAPEPAAAQPAPQPAPPAPPREIPASAVQYLEVPVPIYPRASRRAGEAGRVLVRVFIDEAGLPRQVLVHQSSGFARLDEAATAAVRKARFKPYSDNGQPVAGWALVPLSFDLEK